RRRDCGSPHLGDQPSVHDCQRFAGLRTEQDDDCHVGRCAGAGTPTHMAIIVLFSPQTGEPLAVMDGRLITEMRTAAVSAAATKYLAPLGSRVLALLGSGVQAQAHLEALSHLHPYDEIRVWSRTPEHAARFAAAHGATASSAEMAVRGADV